MRKTITADNTLSTKKYGPLDRGRVSYDEDKRAVTIVLKVDDLEHAIKITRVAASFAKKQVKK